MSFVESIRSRMALTLLVSGVLTIFLAGAAQATTTRYYSELLTSEATLSGPTNTRTVVDSTTFYADPYSIMLNGTTTAGAGIGSGYISPSSAAVYTHTFAPTVGVSDILSATISIGVLDDQLLDREEQVSIYIDDAFWAQGWATVNLFSGDVTAALIAGSTPNEIQMAIFSMTGDTTVQFSQMTVAYVGAAGGAGGGQPGPSVPEPSAALLFVAGFAVVRRAARRT